jgi:uncharacterized protein YdaU (DUF1376 family)
MSAPYMQLYVADYLGDTRHLTTEQHGAYLLLLMTMWRSDGVLSDDPAKLARIAGLTVARWNKISHDVLAFFTPCDGGFTQGRLVAELTIADEKSEKRSRAGKAGARAKALKDKKAGVANAMRLPKHLPEPEPEPEPEREAIASLDIVREAAPTRTEIARGFLAFWQVYPKRVGKDAAAKSFDKAMRRAGGPDPLETIMDGLRRALPGWDDPQFIPNPTTWLDQGRWTDDTPAPSGLDDRPANDHRPRASHAQPSRAERDQSAALEVLARRGALPRQDFGGDVHDLRPPGAQGAGGGGLAGLPTGNAA